MSQTDPQPDDAQEPPRPSLYQAAALIEQAGSLTMSQPYRADSLATQAIAHAAVCQAIAAEQQAKLLAGIRDRLDTLIRQGARGLHSRRLPPIPPTPRPPTVSER